MANNELYIYLKLVDQASGVSASAHRNMQQHIRQTADTEARARRDAMASFKRQLQAEVNFGKERQRLNQQWMMDQQRAMKAVEATRQNIDKQHAASIQARNKLEAASNLDGIRLLRTRHSAEAAASSGQRAALRQETTEFIKGHQERAAVERSMASDHGREFRERLQAEGRGSEELHRKELRSSRYLNSESLRATRARSREEMSEARKATREWTEAITKRSKITKERLGEEKNAIMGVARAYTQLRIAAVVDQGIRAAFQAYTESLRNAKEYSNELADNLERARNAAVELAALKGKQPTAAFVADEAMKAAEEGVTPEEHHQAELTFRAFSQQYIGKEGATDEERKAEIQEGKIPFEQATEFQKQSVISGAAQGIPQAAQARLTGALFMNHKPGEQADVQGMLLRERRIGEVMKNAAGEQGPLTEQFAELAAEAAGPGGPFNSLEDAAVFLRSVSGRRPEESFTYARAAVHGLRDIRKNKHGEMERLGIDRKMDPFQMLAQIEKKVPELVAEGEPGTNEQDVYSEFFQEARELGGISTAINAGLRGKGIERARKEMAAITPETIKKENQDYLQGQVGSLKTENSRNEAAKLRAAQVSDEWKKRLIRANTELIESGDLREGESVYDAIRTKSGEEFGQGGRPEQDVKRRAMYGLRRDLYGYVEGKKTVDAFEGRYPWTFGIGINKGFGQYTPNAQLEDMANQAATLRRRAAPNVISATAPDRTPQAHVFDGMQGPVQQLGGAAKDLKSAVKTMKGPVPQAMPAAPNVGRR